MYFRITNWKIRDESKLKQDLKLLRDWDYEIVKYKKDRTSEQNRYLRGGVYGTISEFTWEDDLDYIHYQMGSMFLMNHTKKKPYIKSTKKLNTQEFGYYVEQIRNFMLQRFNCYIPTPEEYKASLGLLPDNITDGWET